MAQLTKALANEWASKGINVNAIAPGYMATDNTTALRQDPQRSRQILERIPAGRWGEPSTLPAPLFFFARPPAIMFTGMSWPSMAAGWAARKLRPQDHLCGNVALLCLLKVGDDSN